MCDEELINATDGIPISNGENIQNYKLYVITEDGDMSYKASSETAKVNASYDKFTGKLTITVEDEETLTN